MQYLVNASSETVVAGGNRAGTSNIQLFNPRRLYYCSSSNTLLIGNSDAQNIVRWKLGASSWTIVAGSSSGSRGGTPLLLNAPHDLALDSMGSLYVADENSERIQLFLPSQWVVFPLYSVALAHWPLTINSTYTSQIFITIVFKSS